SKDQPDVLSAGIPQVMIRSSRSLDADIERTADDIQPYVVIDREAIRKSGAENVEDLLKTRLSMNYAALSNNQTTGSITGNRSSIALRGLSADQTLSLIDGRRAGSLVAGGTGTQVDLNAIPLAAIERIEVLPTTASGIYGGSATGGVVNVVLRREYTGIN